MMKSINLIGTIITAVALWILLHMAIDSKNPCSNFSAHPELCRQI